jgi:hypothetical protein
VQGFYFSVTDKNSKGTPGDWRYMTQGSALLDDLVLAFTVLSNDPKEPEAAATLEMLKGARREPPQPGEAAATPAPAPGVASASAEPGRKEVRVALPDKSWALALDLPGFKVSQQQVRPDKSGAMMQAENEQSHVIVSAFVERERKNDSVEDCKKDYWGKASKSPLRKKDIHEVRGDGVIAVHFIIPEFEGVPANQKNINAYLYRDGTCIDIHLSKVMFKPEDEALFSAILDTVRFVEK